MNVAQIILVVIAIILVILGFLGWRIEFNLPLFNWWIYIIGGVLLGIAVYWGRIIGRFLMVLSILPFGYALVMYLFSKSTTWTDVSDSVLYGGISLVGGIILYFIGSESVAADYDARIDHYSKDVFCASCDQHLGKAGSFNSPCPRCGSNRYTVQD